MKVLGGPKQGDFYHHRGFYGAIGERLDERAYLGEPRQVVAADVASLGPVAQVVEQVPQVAEAIVAEAQVAEQTMIPQQRVEMAPAEVVA
jgi:hypothetical protein